MSKQATLSDEQAKKLIEKRTPADKEKVLALYLRGYKHVDIAKLIGVNSSRISQILTECLPAGFDVKKPTDGLPAKFAAISEQLLSRLNPDVIKKLPIKSTRDAKDLLLAAGIAADKPMSLEGKGNIAGVKINLNINIDGFKSESAAIDVTPANVQDE